MSLNKRQFALEHNILNMVKINGENRVALLTLTFPDNVVSNKEASRRFNSLSTHLLPELFGPDRIVVKERQKRGAWHYHILVDLGFDLLPGQWMRRGRGYRYINRDPRLFALWSKLRKKLPLFGFGRHELLPLRKSGPEFARYVSKYLGKHYQHRLPEDKGVRLFSYSRTFDHLLRPSNFSWCSPTAALMRKTVRYLAHMFHGVSGFDDVYDALGRYWGHMLYKQAAFYCELRGLFSFAAAMRGSPHGEHWADYSVADGLLIDYQGEVLF